MYNESEKHFRHALEVNKSQLGPAHPAVATTLDDLAGLLSAQGKDNEAESLYRDAIAAFEQKTRSEDPFNPLLVFSLQNLAKLLLKRSSYREAEILYLRALEIAESQLGLDHAVTASSVIVLLNLIQHHSQDVKAKPLERIVVDQSKLEAGHPSAALELNRTGSWAQHQGMYEEAERFYQWALAIFESRFGAEHQTVAYSLSCLANLSAVMGKNKEAETLFGRALHIYESQLGRNHPLTIAAKKTFRDYQSR